MIERAVWRELARAASDRLHEWRIVTLANVAQGKPSLRSMVLREVNENRWQLLFYSDSRSPKVAQLKASPEAMLMVWSRELGWQVRMTTTVQVDDSSPAVSKHWAKVKASTNSQDYLAALPPGTPVQHFKTERGTREHFAVLTATVTALDWLELHAQGHRRASFDGDGHRWLTP